VSKLFLDGPLYQTKNWDEIIKNARTGQLNSIVEDVFKDVLSYEYSDDCRFTSISEICKILFENDPKSPHARKILDVHLKVIDVPTPTISGHAHYLWPSNSVEVAIEFGHFELALKGIKRCLKLGHASDLGMIGQYLFPHLESKKGKIAMNIKKIIDYLRIVPETQGEILSDLSDHFLERGKIKHSYYFLSMIFHKEVQHYNYLFWLLNLDEKQFCDCKKEVETIKKLAQNIHSARKRISLAKLTTLGENYFAQFICESKASNSGNVKNNE